MNIVGEMKDVYTIAKFVGISGDKITKFLNVAEATGYVLVKKEDLPPAAHDEGEKK